MERLWKTTEAITRAKRMSKLWEAGPSQLIPPPHGPNRVYFPNIPLKIMKGGVHPGAKDADKKLLFMKVQPSMGKMDIRAFLRQVYNVDVVKVNTANYQGRLRRVGKKIQRDTSYKKAYIVFKGKDAEEEQAKS